MTAPALEGTLESALYAKDLAAAERFYTGVFGLEVARRKEGRHVFFRVGGSILLVFNPEATALPPDKGAALPVPPHGATGPGHYCFSVSADRMDAWRAHLESKGVEIEADFRWPGGARSIYLRDPAGNSIELAEPALWL